MRIQNKILLGAVVFVLCAAAAYAQVSISSIPVTQVRKTGRGELSGAVRITAGASLSATQDTFTIRYGIPITNGTTAANGGGIAVDPLSSWTGCTIAQPLDYVNGVMTITGCSTAAVAGNYFQINGVRLSLDGFAAPVSATIGALQNTIIAGQQAAVVIESAGDGLLYVSSTTKANNAASTITANQLTFLANGTNVTNNVTNTAGNATMARMFLKEGFAAAWKILTDEGLGATQATQILLTVSPALPTGLSITPFVNIDAAAGTTNALAGTNAAVSYPNAIFGQTAITGTYATAVLSINGESLSTNEIMEVEFQAAVSATAALPLAQGSFTVTATLTPNDPALTTTGLPYTATNTNNFFVTYHAPKFAVANVSQQILTVVANATNLLIPYATTASNYNTGIAFANTTTDPFGTASGGATVQKGPITFYFYANDGTTITPYTTAAGSPGTGLDASGNLTSGSTYVVLLTQLLTAANRTTPFSGYIIAVAGAPNVHGIAFVSDFAGKFTSFTPALIIPNTGGVSRTTVAFNL